MHRLELPQNLARCAELLGEQLDDVLREYVSRESSEPPPSAA